MNNVIAPNHLPVVTSSEVTLIHNNSLLTETPEEGQLAVKLLTLF